MCGICGFAGRDDEDLARRMTATLAHRGPDGEGVRSFAARDGRPPAALGHRRLSIIDPTPRGGQPMSYAGGRYWVTYNGEIYNFTELRAELEADGFSFKSDCDTEVVLAMYARYGRAMLTRLNGIYAFAIWDDESGELFMARDRLGVKPLYHAQRDGVLYFASEVKALLPAIGRPALRHTAVADFLTFLWVPDPDTMFDGVQKLPPGHCATYANGKLRIEQWWDMHFEPDGRGTSDWAPEVRDGVSAAVRRQMVSDVPLGSFLSGGIDSSAIVAEMTEAADRVTTYSIGFDERDLGHEIVPDDLRYSRLMGERFNTDYNERILDADIVDLLPKLIWHLDEPVADPAAITTYLICSAAREKLKVVLSGMGGDEVFAGYPRHLAARIARLADLVLPRPARSGLRRAVSSHMTMGGPGRLRGPRRNMMKLMRGIDAPWRERYLTYVSYYRPEELDRLLSDELRGELADHDPFRHHRTYFDRVSDQHRLNQLLYVDMKTFLPCLNLTYTDKMSMAASTEVRVPLLDDELVALSGRIPAQLKLRRLTRKYVFKRSQEGVLPRDVIWRPKAGFGAPLRSWLIGDLKGLVDEVLAESTIVSRGLLEPSEVRRMIRANEQGTEDNALRIWALLTLELWQRTFTDAPAEPASRGTPVPFGS